MQQYNDNQLINDENDFLSMSVISLIGDRDNQQDRFGYIFDDKEAMIVICDGMGGHEGGSTASNLTISLFLDNYKEMFTSGSPEQSLIYYAKYADKKVYSLKKSDGTSLNAGSTCVALIIRERKLYWCSVGDSRAYMLRNDEFVQMTQDQNYRKVLIERLNAGIIAEDEYRKEIIHGEALISYIGIGDLKLIDYNKIPISLEKGDKIIVMTDGLYKLVPEAEIRRIIENFRKEEEALRALETKAKRASKLQGVLRDNMTVSIITVK